MNKKQRTYKLTTKSIIASCSMAASLATSTAIADEKPKQCPVTGHGAETHAQHAMTNKDWWPNQLDLSTLRQNSQKANPLSSEFNYAKAFASIDLDALKKELKQTMRTSQAWWPADYGHYGPFFVRMAWHSAGTYRSYDGRGGARFGLQRFAPLNSWPDNGNLDKARRLLWPIKQKYGKKLSWADLMILAGTVAIEDMGLKTLGFGGGRADVWEPQKDIYWGPEKKWLASQRHDKEGKLDKRLAADELGLIYVNPEGPHGNPDPIAAAARIRETFGRMGMNDEETVALIAGGHTFGKAHGAASAKKHVGSAPEGATAEEQGFGWKNSYGKGNAEDTITSGLEGAWTSTPARWSHQYFVNLFEFDWELTTSPAGAKQWKPKDNRGQGLVPDAHRKDKRHAPMMFTTDIALKKDPAYAKISKNFLKNPLEFDKAFAKAWFKLTHRDMGQRHNLVGVDVPEAQLWQDPLPVRDYDLIDANDIAKLKLELLDSGLSLQQLVTTAWASAASFRQSDFRGGTDGARLRLAPQKDWEVNQPEKLAKVLTKLGAIQSKFNKAQAGEKQVSIADLIVLGGAAAIEKASSNAGFKTSVPFTPGRTDASQKQTDVDSFAVLKPSVDGFRNYQNKQLDRPAAQIMVNHAQQLGLTAPEMTVLVGGMRSLGATAAYKRLGDFSDKDNQLTNDYFINLLDMKYQWKKSENFPGFYEGVERSTGKPKYAATSMDLVFGSNSELRAIAEVYASDDAKQKFTTDFVKAWVKVMNNGRK